MPTALPSWIVVGLLSVALFIIVIVPAGYMQVHRTRTIYVCVLAPVMFVLYLVLLYVLLYRPLKKTTEVYSRGVYCQADQPRADVWQPFKELRSLNKQLRWLSMAEAEMRASTAMLTEQAGAERGLTDANNAMEIDSQQGKYPGENTAGVEDVGDYPVESHSPIG